MSKLLAAILASMKTRKWWWAGGGGAALVAIAAAVVVFGGFFGPSGKAICTVAVEHARDYGIIPPSAVVSNAGGKSTDVKNRRLCTASANGNSYNILADLVTGDTTEVKCKNIKDITKSKDCIALYSVERSDGLSMYQVRQVPDDDTDVPVDAANAGGGETQKAGNVQNAGDAQGNALDSDLQPTTGTHSDGAGQQAAPQQ